MTTEAKPRGKYFEDFEVGETMVSPARTVTSTDIVNFACLSGDFNEVHTNFEYCKTTQFGEPINIDGVETKNGDYILGDIDGVVIIPENMWTKQSSWQKKRLTGKTPFEQTFPAACRLPKHFKNTVSFE